MRTEDGYIIRKCLDGDPVAFGLLVDKYKESIYALAYAKLLNFHDAQDITQEAFIKAYRKLHTLKRQNNFLAWLYAITSNLCKDWIRSHSKRPDREFVEDQEPEVLDKPSLFSYRESLVRQSVHEALDSLPETYREALSLYYLSGLSVKEIAKFLGTSPHAIDIRLSRARMKLKEEMLIMMSATFAEGKLPSGFTFRMVEMVKRISIWPRAPWLPWGLSLAAGTILTVLGFISYPIIFNPIVDLVSSAIPKEMRVLEVGEIPVDVVEVSEVPIIDGGRGGSRTAPTLRDALAFLFAPQGGEGKWTKKADMPQKRYGLSAATVNGKIYAIGGSGDVNKDLVEEYDPVTDTWTKKADMPTPRVWLAASAVNGKIYAIGGTDLRGNDFSAVEEYDPVKDKWTKKADMPTARIGHSTSVVNGKIYAIGGAIGGGRDRRIASTVEEYDPVADKWTKKADMPTPRIYLATGVVNGKIYAIGGRVGGGFTSAVEEYDPVADKWTKKADMPTIRDQIGIGVVGRKIYAIGGSVIPKAGWNNNHNNEIAVSTVEEYDPVTDTWTKKADMPTSRFQHATSVVDGKVYAIGGLSGQGWGWGNLRSTVEEFDLGFAGEGEEGQGVEAKGKHVTTWGKMKK